MNLKLLNLSTNSDSIWTDFIVGTSQTNTMSVDFKLYVKTLATKFPTNSRKSIFLEASLEPFLSQIKQEDRVKFLETNIANLAQTYLKFAVEVQSVLPRIVICTYVHCKYSRSFLDELICIREFA